MVEKLPLKGFATLLAGLFFLVSGCSSNDDDSSIPPDSFYQGALVDPDLKLLNKYWSVFEVNYQKTTAEVPKLYGNCDRDFFIFQKDSRYKEYIITDSGCIPTEQNLKWSFARGVITLENSFKDYNEMVIVELTADKFIFRAKYDIDEDGEEDVLQFMAKPYRPDESNFYTNNLAKDESISNKMRLTWSEYDGINNFDRYEIHLSGESCNLSQSKRIATISEKGTSYFEDLDPPLETYYCYFLKVYTDKGLLFESHPVGISAEALEVPGVLLEEPLVQNNGIFLQWEKYNGLYFSHYEVVEKNYLDGTAEMYQERSLGEISDINENNLMVESLPLVKNPVYEIRVYNKFGSQNYYNPQVVQSARETNYIPERVIDLRSIHHIAYSPGETIVFLNGEDDNYSSHIVRYNYGTRQVEALSNTETVGNGIGRNDLKLIDSSIGSELLYLKYNGISVFDPQTLQFKYDLKLNGADSLEGFLYLGNDRFLLLSDRYAYTVLRDFSNLTLLDRQEHFSEGANQFGYRVLQINDGRILIGNMEHAQSIAFRISEDGKLLDKSTLNIPITGRSVGESIFNPKDNSIINFRENRIYDLASASLKSFEQPYFPSALTLDGTKILGTNNDPEWHIDPASLHVKKMGVLDLTTSNFKIFETEGYPHYLFENHLGQIVSISTYYKRSSPKNAYDRPDFFVEIVEQ